MVYQPPNLLTSTFRHVSALIVAIGCFAGLGEVCHASGPAAQRIVVSKTMEALPDPLLEYFTGMQEAVLERALEPGGFWQREPRFKTRSQWSYVYLDAAAETPDQRARMQSADAFPTEQALALGMMRKLKIKRGGELPWALENLTKELSHAFEKGDRDEVATQAGYIIAFCTYAANPFHLTRNDHGEESGNLSFGPKELGDPLFAHQDVAQRFGWELLRRFQHRYQSQIDVSQFQYPLGQGARQMIFNTMLSSLEDLEAFCSADRAILEKMKVDSQEAFEARMDEYYGLLDEANGDAAVEMLRRASRLAVALIYHAYDQAGSPNLNPTESSTKIAAISQPLPAASPEPGATDPSGKSDSPTAADAPLTIRVASKNSKVFHLPTCSHVKRISAKNRVEYENEQAALASGKRRCNTCLGNSDE